MIVMKRFLTATTTLLAALSFSVAAVAAPAAPDDVVKTATNELQADISKNHDKYAADKPLFYKMVDVRLLQYFDTPYIAQLILARNWKTATPDQRKRFEAAFKNMLIRSYADALLQYHDSVKAEVKPVQMAAGATTATVSSSLLRKDGPPVQLSFDMRLKNDAWKVFDIKVENISLVTNFRSQVASQIKASSLDAVIQKLESGQNVIAPPDTSAGAKS